ncbi:hypothetical protein F442_14350 [Phytophthora nicotianae P10297]|uniref:Uncharacterized protein n=1 Tax=Phytophthora nicotianae P10297 TaxID=1317064 RepID=W2YS89_PHYNI|nr:hypothetical protein F442_14350 [Phytophthora nicotianae P10297]
MSCGIDEGNLETTPGLIKAWITLSGILPSWKAKAPPRRNPTKNHKSARTYQAALLKSIRQGQADETYLVVNISLLQLQQWKSIQCSPFGAVEKKGLDPQLEVRPIHDLSYPDAASTNDNLDPACLPDISYTTIVAIVRRIEELARTHPGIVIEILKGDVKSAFIHFMTHTEHVCWMGATLPEEYALIIDLAAPFG